MSFPDPDDYTRPKTYDEMRRSRNTWRAWTWVILVLIFPPALVILLIVWIAGGFKD